MRRFDNPFHDLWVTEILHPDEFVRMFSPTIVQDAGPLFSSGNVVLRGRQGSGKSMLLNLLSTKTRIAYCRIKEESYPVHENHRKFISAGVNLARDDVRIVAARLSERGPGDHKEWLAAVFADFINYLVCIDLLKNVLLLGQEQREDRRIIPELPISQDGETQSHFAHEVANSDVWYGYLKDCSTPSELLEKMTKRLRLYRQYFNFNSDALDQSVDSSKTEIGEPIARLADLLRSTGMIPAKSLIFVRLDQHEELFELERASGYGSIFRQVINKALAMRDGRVHYRIGTRHYAWEEELTVWGSGAPLEHMRDYNVVDLDQIFRRHENGTGWQFPAFANDVFSRRLRACNIDLPKSAAKDPLRAVFGDTLPADDRAKLYTKGNGRAALKLPAKWAKEWKEELIALWESGKPLGAKLGEAWLRQDKQTIQGIPSKAGMAKKKPWLEKSAQYWRKERNEAALVQIAGDLRQALVWSGKKDLVHLSGSNILAFMSLCRAIWSAWLRSKTDQELIDVEMPIIDINEQTIGINEASRLWFEKLREGQHGSARSRLIQNLGTSFSSSIRKDRALSYPGRTGFSLLRSEFETATEVTALVRQSRDHGDLVESQHTTKEKDLQPRIKWYLNPILCPHFRIPYIRTKEPLYLKLSQLEILYKSAGAQNTADTPEMQGIEIEERQPDFFRSSDDE